MVGAFEAMNWAGRRTVATVVHAVARGMSGIRAAAVRRHNMRIAPCPPKRRRSESNRRIEVLQGAPDTNPFASTCVQSGGSATSLEPEQLYSRQFVHVGPAICHAAAFSLL